MDKRHKALVIIRIAAVGIQTSVNSKPLSEREQIFDNRYNIGGQQKQGTMERVTNKHFL